MKGKTKERNGFLQVFLGKCSYSLTFHTQECFVDIHSQKEGIGGWRRGQRRTDEDSSVVGGFSGRTSTVSRWKDMSRQNLFNPYRYRQMRGERGSGSHCRKALSPPGEEGNYPAPSAVSRHFPDFLRSATIIPVHFTMFATSIHPKAPFIHEKPLGGMYQAPSMRHWSCLQL